MNHLIWITAVAGLLAGCGAPPEPILIADLENGDRRFEAPSRPAERSLTQDLLAKDELSLLDVLAIADAMNPQLAIERKNIDLASAAIWEAKLYPNPSFLFSVEDYKVKDGFGSSKRTAGFAVPIVVSGRIGAATALAEKDREVAALTFVWKRREILSDVKRAFASLMGSRRNVELTRETRDLAKAFHDVTNDRFKAQAIPEMELLKAAVQLAKSESDVRLAEKDLAVSLKALHSLMGNTDFPKEKFAGELYNRFVTPSFEALRGHIVAVHPLLEAATKAKEAAELNLSLAKAERMPDPSFEIRGGIDGERDALIEAGFSIPLPLFNRNQARIATAEIRIRQAELQIQVLRNDLTLRLTEAYKNFSAGQDRVAVYRDEILPKAQKALDQTTEGYKQGKFSYLDVLDAQRTLAEARIAYAVSLGDLNLSQVELEKLTGTRIEPVR
jgi:cobalt-zinc-cadmium efflux system outer membrane protein